MSRHLMKLQVLFAKLEARYGADDPAVKEIGEQLNQLEILEREGAALRAARVPATASAASPS